MSVWGAHAKTKVDLLGGTVYEGLGEREQKQAGKAFRQRSRSDIYAMRRGRKDRTERASDCGTTLRKSWLARKGTPEQSLLHRGVSQWAKMARPWYLCHF